MWRECCTGDFTIATNALAREYVRHEGEGSNADVYSKFSAVGGCMH